MFINVASKAQPLFKAYPQVADSAVAKQLTQANPLFSWHANYLTVNRKKTVIMTHDASTLTIVLTDVNAKNRHQLADRFWVQLQLLWQQNELPAAAFTAYRQVAGDWQINKTINRSLLGYTTEYTSDLKWWLTNGFPQFNPDAYVQQLSQIQRKDAEGQPVTARDLPTQLAVTNLKWHATAPTNTTALKAIWKQLATLDQQTTGLLDEGDTQKLDDHVEQIQRTNQQPINWFIKAIQTDYSAKTITNYRKALEFYLNEYLAYHLTTLRSPDATNVGELFLHGVSETELKRTRRSTARLYQFLQQNGLISAADLRTAKQDLKGSVDSVLAGFDFYDPF
ncbi:recombinase XerD [Lactiplantibacillus garii]|uniref:Recombinase XerD n=1 Tax=Lactiplantibacillus garii TaxID=2306423 RepID=A0A426D826_9LACO|nr:recombinase XerD [Lactiplantibacillus garii]RRK10762.1 recombinase XerD [Lactiplantibacillus garii]